MSGSNVRGGKDASQYVARRTSTSPLQAFTIVLVVREQADTPCANCSGWYVNRTTLAVCTREDINRMTVVHPTLTRLSTLSAGRTGPVRPRFQQHYSLPNAARMHWRQISFYTVTCMGMFMKAFSRTRVWCRVPGNLDVAVSCISCNRWT